MERFTKLTISDFPEKFVHNMLLTFTFATFKANYGLFMCDCFHTGPYLCHPRWERNQNSFQNVAAFIKILKLLLHTLQKGKKISSESQTAFIC